MPMRGTPTQYFGDQPRMMDTGDTPATPIYVWVIIGLAFICITAVSIYAMESIKEVAKGGK